MSINWYKNKKVSMTDRIFYYDILYEAANNLFLAYSPCRIDINGKCVASKNNRCHSAQYYTKHTGCCRPDCRYITSKGCSTNSLGCKLFVCDSLRDIFPEFVKEINRLKKIFGDMNLPWNVWQSKEDWIKIERKQTR